jgi:Fe2+ transport system protein FeoA
MVFCSGLIYYGRYKLTSLGLVVRSSLTIIDNEPADDWASRDIDTAKYHLGQANKDMLRDNIVSD